MKNIRAFVDAKLVERLNHVDNLTKIILESLGLKPQKHLLWVVRERRTLTVFAQDNILATQLRLQQEKIIQQIREKTDLLIDTVKIQMTMPQTSRSEIKMKTYTLTQKNAQAIKSIATNVEDEELKEMLLRIASQADS